MTSENAPAPPDLQGSGGAPPTPRGPALRIAFFTDSFVPTHDGVANATDTLARTLQAAGHDVVVYTVGIPLWPSAEAREDGVRVRRFLGLPAPGYPQYRIALFPWFIRTGGTRGFDIVHVHTPGLVGAAGWWFARRHRIPTVGTYHTNLSDMLRGSGRTRASRGFFRAWGRFSVDLCRACDLATAPTKASLRALIESKGEPHAPVPRVVPNGVDTTRFRPAVMTPDWRTRWRLAPQVSVITFLGRLTRDKGVLRFLDATERLGTSPEWCAVVGGEGPQEGSVRRRISPGTPLAGRVRYLGPVSEGEKPALLAQSQVFVLPSLSDTSSVALIEAMACGAAGVVTSRGGPAEIVRLSSAGLLVDPEDPEAMATAISLLLSDESLRQSHVYRGREWVVAHASAVTMADGFLGTYRSLLAGTRPPGPAPSVRLFRGRPSQR